MGTAPVPSKIETVTGSSRPLIFPAVTLTIEDVRRLHTALERKAKEAADRQVAALEKTAAQSQTAFDALRAEVRSSLALVIRVQGTNGEWDAGIDANLLSESSLPSNVLQIEFQSSFLFNIATKQLPQNYFSVTLNFGRTGIFDVSSEPTVIHSSAQIVGRDRTWVNAVHSELVEFFQERHSLWGWLHGARSYDAVVVLAGFPFSMVVVYKFDKLISGNLTVPNSLAVAFYVYVTLLSLFFCRLVFNYAKWVFPRTELKAATQRIARRHIEYHIIY